MIYQGKEKPSGCNMQIPSQATLVYRAEIDALRALAVVAVVLYHAHVPFMDGGFAGVNVFFAISGYVVIASLHRERTLRGRVDWIRFAVRRVRRLLPLLWVTIAASLVLAYWLLPPDRDFQLFCKSAIAALVMSANWFFWRDSTSYFGSSLEQAPLMHLWSLSVEEQFYLMVPLIYFCSRLKTLGGAARLIWTLGILSFAMMVWGSFEYPVTAFYLPFTHAWEFGVGALAALAPRNRPCNTSLAWTLLCGIALSFILLPHTPSHAPLLGGIPALLTACLLWQTKTSLPQSESPKLLLSRPLLWIGQRSYAWYLLHWPAMVFYRRYWIEDVSTVGLVLVGVFSLGLADFAHRWIEVPCRYQPWHFMTQRLRPLVLALLGTAALSTMLFTFGVNASARQIDARWQSIFTVPVPWANQNDCLLISEQDIPPKPCVTGQMRPGKPTIILWGDSHANQFWGITSEIALEQKTVLRTWASGGCPPIWPRSSTLELNGAIERRCAQLSPLAHTDITNHSAEGKTIVVLVARWAPYLAQTPISAIDKQTIKDRFKHIDVEKERALFRSSLASTVEELTSKGVQVILIASVPEQRVAVPACLARFGVSGYCMISRQQTEAYRELSTQMLQELAHDNAAVQVVDPFKFFCDLDYCRVGTLERPWYLDDDHLSTEGAGRVKPALRDAIQEAERRLTVLAGKIPSAQ